MRRRDRVLVLAVAASAVAHLLALLGTPRFDLGVSIEDLPAPPPIEARIIRPPIPAPVLTPAKPAPDKRRATRRAAPPLPLLAQDPVVPQYDYPEGVVEAVPSASADGPAASPDPASENSAPPVEAAAAPAEYPLRRARLVFDLFYGAQPSKVGQVTHTWAQDGREYRVETIAEAVGFVSWFLSGRLVQRASGVFAAAGLVPTEYRAELGMRERTETAHFDWTARKLALASKGETRLVDLPAGAQDPLSMLHQLYFLMPIPDAAQFDIVTGRKLYRYRYHLIGEAQFETPIGIVRALHMQRRDPDGASMDVWLDLDRNLLPARIHVVDRKGRVLEQVIREARLDVGDPAQ
jgi:hypothetical protein